MKHIVLTLLVTLGSALAAEELRLVHFTPATGRALLYIDQDGFRRDQPRALDTLPEASRTEVQAALQWLATQIPPGVAIDSVILAPQPARPSAYDEAGEPTAWQRMLAASVTFTGPLGSQSIELANPPDEIRTGLLAVWDELSGEL